MTRQKIGQISYQMILAFMIIQQKLMLAAEKKVMAIN